MRRQVGLATIGAVVVLSLVWFGAGLPAGQAPGTNEGVRRTADRKPDLNGVWQALTAASWDLEDHNAQKGVPAGQSVVEGGTIPYLPAAAATKKTNYAKRAELDPLHKCYLPGVPRLMYMPFPFRINQTPELVSVTFEYNHAYRWIWTDGSKHPEAIDFWMGDSRGRWEGDTLVVDVTNFNGNSWFDRAGNFHSDALRLTERFTPRGADHILYEVTVEDAKTFSKPWKFTVPLYRRIEQNVQTLDYECLEFEEPLLEWDELPGPRPAGPTEAMTRRSFKVKEAVVKTRWVARNAARTLAGMAMLATAMAGLATVTTAGQEPASWPSKPAKPFVPKKLPDGQPDIQGIYTNQWVVPIERFSKEERDAFAKAIVEHRGPNTVAGPGNNGSYGNEWFDRPTGGTGRPTNSPHPQGHVAVIDPPDGKIPWQPWALAKKTYIRDHPFETRAIYDYRVRCLPAGTPRGTFFSYYNGWQVQQPPGKVVILYEHNHLYRVIRLDGSPHPGPNVQLWMGDSVGRWEGNTLVVDVKNFTGKTWVVGDLGGEGMHTGSFHSPALHVVERFTIVDADNIDYEATIEDPNVFTRPWKLGFRIFSRAPKDYTLFEYACHEGNKTIDLMKDVFKR